MGAYLSQPITDKETDEGESALYKYGVAAMQGWRSEMEDAHAVCLNIDESFPTGFFAVFDGHGGKEVARFCAIYMARELVTTAAYKQQDLDAALKQVFLRMDELLGEDKWRDELRQLAGSDKPAGDEGEQAMLSGQSMPEVLQEALRLANARRQGGGEEGEWEEEDGDMHLSLPGNLLEELQNATASSDDEDDSGEESGSSTDALPLSESPGAAARMAKRKRNLGSETPSEQAGEEGHDRGPSSSTSANRNAQQSGSPELEDSSEDSEAGPQQMEQSPGRKETGGQSYVGPSAGCTAVVALVRGTKLLVANAGDSRCVMSRGGKAVAMTHDHKPTDTEEHDRIIKAGGFITEGRVNGSLNLSRALGDMDYKQRQGMTPQEQMVTAFPEVRSLDLQEGDDFLLLACDGIWDVMTNQEAVDFVGQRLRSGMAPRKVSEALCDTCLAPDTRGCGKGCDNMSVLITILRSFSRTVPLSSAASTDPMAGDRTPPPTSGFNPRTNLGTASEFMRQDSDPGQPPSEP
ncbi:hypothetical protein WJX74_005666 [Apatococcus lobatus]|uniref:protein-serine/threonine phosphatase n=2 Tax=Apatococcus TaxID=904362 RepID=A0AAW1SWL8_9CHLO